MTWTDWRYGLLAPARAPGAEADNAPWLGPRTLGVEITEPSLAQRCGLGNLDPQHGGLGAGRSAIEGALSWPVPPEDARLVTIRPDADAFGAMAVLALRRHGRALKPAGLARLDLIAACDGFDLGLWEAWISRRGPLARPADVDDVAHLPEDYRSLTALAMDGDRAVANRVRALGRWLQDGRLDPAARALARAHAARLAEAWNAGQIEVGCGLHPDLAIVRAAVPGGLQLGYRLAPVVVAEGGRGEARRLTVAQFDSRRLDLVLLKTRLAELEPGWGGSSTLIASPQGVGTRLSLADLEALVWETMTT